jgi:hypothetical protein
MELAQVSSDLIPSDLDGHSLLPLMEHSVDISPRTKDETNTSIKSFPCKERPDFIVSQYHGDNIAMSWFLVVRPMPCMQNYMDKKSRVHSSPVSTTSCLMKLVVWGSGKEVDSQLFDLTRDPDERNNLIQLPKYAQIIEQLDANLRSVVDYEQVAMDVARYNQQSFQTWMNFTSNWKEVLTDKQFRWHASWEEVGTKRAIEAIEEWLSKPQKINACRKDTVWPPSDNSVGLRAINKLSLNKAG